MNDIIKIVKSLEESGLLKKALVKQLETKQKTKRRISGNVIRNLGANLLGRESINRQRNN